MKMRGEITVFLSLILVCVMSLILGLLESARTSGARLYSQMAADSAGTSVMSHYNKNLWEMYHLLFLEAESPEAVEQVFAEYLDFYLEQKNWYPMKLGNIHVTEEKRMTEDGGIGLENSILSYMKYRLPDVFGNLTTIEADAKHAMEAKDFQKLFQICQATGKKTKKLEECRKEIEESLEEVDEIKEKLQDAAVSEAQGRFRTYVKRYEKEYKQFSKAVDAYESEIQKVSEYRDEVRKQSMSSLQGASGFYLEQEMDAYRQVEETAKRQLSEYRQLESVLKENTAILKDALDVLEEFEQSERDAETEMEIEETGPDWDTICNLVVEMEQAESSVDSKVDWNTMFLLERLENLFQSDLLKLVLPEGTKLSKKTVSLKGIPSKQERKSRESNFGLESLAEDATRKFLVNEYCFLSFDSFSEKEHATLNAEKVPLHYEVEYLLCGKGADRENLAETIEKLLAVRGAMNLLYLLSDPEKKGEADVLALTIAGGNASLKAVLSFFIVTLWALGEAVLDLKQLMAGGAVPFWKETERWELELEGLLTMQFLEPVKKKDWDGRNYEDHLRILLFMAEWEERNFRMMDLIQWKMRTLQEDFSIEDCLYEVEIEAEIYEKHLFLLREEYKRTVRTIGVY